MTTKTIGRRIARIEDADLIRGKGRFVDDIHVDGMLNAVFVRSPHAHAKIISIAKETALAAPGVRAVLTADDIARHVTTDLLSVALPDRTYKQQRDRPILARHETVYAGEAVAIVIADAPYLAEDAAALVEIDYEPLPAVTD
ncbi:MAG: xanthine dehydrogenase family protein molybdopterin-binding subunit, partial [Xanthobacteraceae bacterium]